MNRIVPTLAIAFLLSPQRPGGAEDWYRFRGPRLDGVSTESTWNDGWPDSGPEIAWTATVGTGFSSMSVSDGRLYTIGNEENIDTVFCLDAKSGSEIWKHAYPSPTDPNEFEGGPTSTPTVDGDEVFTLGRRGDLFCFDKVSGKVHWTINAADEADVRIPAWGFAGSPLVWRDLLILNVGDAGMAVHKESGSLAWASTDKDSGYASPVPLSPAADNRVILGSARSYVCVDATSGRELWRQKWLTTFGCNAADAIVSHSPASENRKIDQRQSGPSIFLSSGYNRGCALLTIDDNEPTIVWKNKEMQNQLGNSVLIGGYLYGIHGDVVRGARLRCIELATGDVMWTNDTFRPGAISAAAGRLVMLSDSGELIVGTASPAAFEVTSRHRVLDGKCWTAPVLSHGRIYCRSAEGIIVCVDVR